MHACPSSVELQNFLDEALDADYVARILAHIEECYLCQQSLERLTVGIAVIEDGLAPAALPPEVDATVDLAGTEIAAEGDRPPTGNLQGVGPPGAQTDVSDPAGEMGEHTEPDPRLATGPGVEGVYSGRTETDVRGPEATADGPETNGSKSCERDPGARGETRNPSDWPTIPGYELLGALGEGGMGVVYKANHLGLKRHVALKMIRGGSHPRANLLARFRTEAEAVARIRHANILQIYDIGEANGLPFVALELLEGGSLGDRLASTPNPRGSRLSSPCSWPGPSMWHTRRESSIVTSSPQTCFTPSTASPRSPTSAWPSGLTPTTGIPKAGRSWARPATWRLSRRETSTARLAS
jgi:hypothetical protein